jgi:predicted nucleotidyltransferase component of viral defense system
MNKAASIRARLQNIAKKENIAFQVIIFRYLHERFLYRLSKSPFKDNFCLKGGVLLYAFEQELTRPTKDVDFLANDIPNNFTEIKKAFKEICHIENDDSVWFNSETLTVEKIKEEDKYEGIRLFIEGGFDVVKQKLQIDIGFGDIIIPGSQTITYPCLLPDSEPAIINAYSQESIIAEKFHAMVVLSYANSRMKDFYDIYNLLQNDTVDFSILEQSIIATFTRRETALNFDSVFNDVNFSKDESFAKQWAIFLRKNKLALDHPFQEIVEFIQEKLQFLMK